MLSVVALCLSYDSCCWILTTTRRPATMIIIFLLLVGFVICGLWWHELGDSLIFRLLMDVTTFISQKFVEQTVIWYVLAAKTKKHHNSQSKIKPRCKCRQSANSVCNSTRRCPLCQTFGYNTWRQPAFAFYFNKFKVKFHLSFERAKFKRWNSRRN
jgi:hypothetical protein